jgi:hypothetical protein
MKKIVLTIALAVASLALVPVAKATLVINSTNQAVVHIDSPSNPGASGIAAALGIPVGDLGSLLYKWDRGSASEQGGLLTGSYQTAITAGGNGYPVIISYVGAPADIALATYLLVKDGNAGSYVFNLASTGIKPLDWDGVENIEIYNLFGWAGKQDIGGLSHFEFYGGTTTTVVPEPSTVVASALLLVPLGVAGLRRLRK